MSDLLHLWSDKAAVSVAVWMLLSITLLYFGRTPAHHLLLALGHGLRQGLRLTSRALGQLEQRQTQRNRDVLLAAARNDSERRIEREFARIQTLVSRELAGYPGLQRQISSAIDNVETRCRDAAEQAPLPPAWSDVVQMIAALPSHGDPAVAKILTTIKEAVEETHRETLKAWQHSSASRHKLLAGMQPQWRTLQNRVDEVGATVDALDKRSHQLDQQLQQFEAIRRGEDAAVRSLTSSSLTQFFISGIVLVIALINFQLIALPMSEMVGGTSYIGALKTSDIAALVIILIEVAMGLFLLESLRITRLFPMISSMDDKMRRRMVVISLTILTVLAGIEASLAYMRDLLALDKEALQQSLAMTSAAAGVAASHAEFRWIPSIGQMVMGFILPFALAFIAIPLESFIQSLRTVLGLLLVAVIRVLAIGSRFLGQVSLHSATLLTHAYDLLIMLPLSVERLLQRRRNAVPVTADAVTTDTDEHSNDQHSSVSERPSRRSRRTSTDDALVASA